MEQLIGKIIVTVGLPASGKSTWAKSWAAEQSLYRVRVCRDDIRRMLGVYWVPSRERLVTLIEHQAVYEAVTNGYDVVIDATNFKRGWIESLAQQVGSTVHIQDFTDVALEVCLARDAIRDHKVGAEVINKFYDKYIRQ
jgi:predicted kinase